MNKNILIVGAPRSGKTTLAKKIAKERGVGLISIDNLVTGFEAFPNLNITHADIVNIDKKLAPFLVSYFGELLSGLYFPDIKYVFEGSYIDFETVIPYLQKQRGSRIEIIGLTCNQLSEEELFNCIRKYDSKYDWTTRRNDEELKLVVHDLMELNHDFTNKFNEYHIKSYDTSLNREEVFEKILAELP